MKEFLENLLKCLDRIEIKGKDNMDILLGCIVAIERAIKELDEAQEEQAEEK